ncbi:MAG: hypothetical protein JO016_00175 [Actinobacteria bacterium]|nr:hypothetical protein [Actinomycetota bacterium]
MVIDAPAHSVRIPPGSITVTLMPSGATSAASALGGGRVGHEEHCAHRNILTGRDSPAAPASWSPAIVTDAARFPDRSRHPVTLDGLPSPFLRAQPGHLFLVSSRRPPRSNRYWARLFSSISALFALAGLAWIVYVAVSGASWAYLGLGCLWLVLAACLIPQARQFSRRERLGYDRAWPAAEQDVLTLVRQGRNIEAIKRYRELNPGVGLKDAKQVVDGLKPSPGG